MTGSQILGKFYRNVRPLIYERVHIGELVRAVLDLEHFIFLEKKVF